MSYQYDIPTHITISTHNLREFGYLHETSRIDKLHKILLDAGFDYAEVHHINDDGKYVSQFIKIWNFGRVPECGPNSGLTEIKARFQKLVEITGGNIDKKHYTAIDEYNDVIVLND